MSFLIIHQFAKLKHRIGIFGMQTQGQAGGCSLAVGPGGKGNGI